MKSLPQFASLGIRRGRKIAAAALFLTWVGSSACSSSNTSTLGNGGTASASGGSGAGTSGASTGGSKNGSAGASGSSTGGSGTSAAGTSGSSGGDGSGAGGSSAGSSGTAHTTAGSSNGGAAGKSGGPSAGAGGHAEPVPFQCDPSDGSAVGTPNSCKAADPTDECQVCVQTKCCTEYAECYAVDPGNQCGWGGPATLEGSPNEGGELLCMQLCLIATIADSGTAPDALQIGTCANHCATALGNGATKECGPVIGSQTSAVVGCLLKNCSIACFGG
jgi:hypothetical protein